MSDSKKPQPPSLRVANGSRSLRSRARQFTRFEKRFNTNDISEAAFESAEAELEAHALKLAYAMWLANGNMWSGLV